MKNDTLYIVMPAYNEEKVIADTIEEWYNKLDFGSSNSRIIVADGGSKDKTLDILYGLKNKYSKLEVISMPGTDHGTKVTFLLKYAIQQGADWILELDSDGQTIPLDFDSFWEMKDTFDCILGNRVNRGDGKMRGCVDWMARRYQQFFFGAKTLDACAPFRLLKADVAAKYTRFLTENCALPRIIHNALLIRYKEKVAFKEITFNKRNAGKSYINAKQVFSYGWNAISDFHKVRRDIRQAEKVGEI